MKICTTSKSAAPEHFNFWCSSVFINLFERGSRSSYAPHEQHHYSDYFPVWSVNSSKYVNLELTLILENKLGRAHTRKTNNTPHIAEAYNFTACGLFPANDGQITSVWLLSTGKMKGSVRKDASKKSGSRNLALVARATGGANKLLTPLASRWRCPCVVLPAWKTRRTTKKKTRRKWARTYRARRGEGGKKAIIFFSLLILPGNFCARRETSRRRFPV